MKVFLLASGEPKKITPLGELVPSPMISLLNRPLMEHTIEVAARQSYKQMFASLHYLPGMIEAFFENGQRWGVKLDYLLQRDQRGNAGAMKWAQRYLDETFLVLPTDRIIDLDIQAALEQHLSQKNAVTIIANKIGYSSEQPVYLNDENEIVPNGSLASGEKPWYATGAYLFEPQALDLVPSRAPMDIQTQLIPLLAQQGLPVRAHCMSGYWNPLNTFDEYYEAQSVMLHNQAPPKARLNGSLALRFYRTSGRQLSPGIWAGKNSSIHPSALLIPPVQIGENSHIERHAEIGPEVVIGSNVIVDEGATVEASTIFDHTYVGQFVNIAKRAVWQNTMVDIPSSSSIKIADKFLLNSLEKDSAASLSTRTRDLILAALILLFSLPVALPLALLLFLSCGRVFEIDLRARPKKHNAYPAYAVESRYFRLVRFASQRKNRSTNGLMRWMKRWGLLRIPELWNVMRGDLSLVGVHPLTPENAARSPEAWQEKLREMTPGMTGLWYIQHIDADNDTELQIADAYYAATRSWKQDWLLILQTPRAWLRRRKAGAQGARLDQQITEGHASTAQPHI